MKKKRKPVFQKTFLPFTKRDFAVVVATSLPEGEKYIKKKLGITLNLSEDDLASTALCMTMDNGAIIMLFRFDKLSAANICHEVTHATNGIFDHIGIRLNPGSDEAFAYHNEMLFRFVVELLTTHNLTVPLLP